MNYYFTFAMSKIHIPPHQKYPGPIRFLLFLVYQPLAFSTNYPFPFLFRVSNFNQFKIQCITGVPTCSKKGGDPFALLLDYFVKISPRYVVFV